MTSDFWVGRYVGQAASDFTIQAYVATSKVSDQGRQVGQKYPKNI